MGSKGLAYEIKRHFADATSISAVATPAAALLETKILNITEQISYDTRMNSIWLLYLGFASISKLRDYSKKRFGIGENSPRKHHLIHDGLFSIPFTLSLKPLVYLYSGETDPEKIAWGTFATLVGGGILSTFGGTYVLDTFKELLGMDEFDLTPKWIKKKSNVVKKSLATLLVATGVGATMGIYGPTIDQNDVTQIPNESYLEQKVTGETYFPIKKFKN